MKHRMMRAMGIAVMTISLLVSSGYGNMVYAYQDDTEETVNEDTNEMMESISTEESMEQSVMDQESESLLTEESETIETIESENLEFDISEEMTRKPIDETEANSLATSVSQEAESALRKIQAEHAIMGVLYLVDRYAVKAIPDLYGDTVAWMDSGQTVWIQRLVYDREGRLWVEVQWYEEDLVQSGYIERYHIACSDELYLAWEQTYQVTETMEIACMRGELEEDWLHTVGSSYPDVAQFPSSYQSKLDALKKAHPNWMFVKMDTKLDFNTVVQEEMKDNRSLINHGKGWVAATKAEVTECLDPRNYLTEQRVFAMEQLTYNASYHTQIGLQIFLNGTFMKGNVQDSSVPNTSDQSYAKAFMLASSDTKNASTGLQVSPYHLASRVYQEQGKGTSPLISGTYPGFEGYYNYFNCSASGNSNEEIYKNGLTFAKQQGWNTRYKSISGGAKRIGTNYILKGQDTIYLEKFDLVGTLYTHQYMQNIQAPESEGKSTYTLYNSSGSINSPFVFKIPVFSNMPGEEPNPAPEPEPVIETFEITVNVPSGYSGNRLYIDGISYDATKNGSKLSLCMQDGKSKIAVMYQYNKKGLPIGMYVWILEYDASIGKYRTTAENGLKNLLGYYGFSYQIAKDPGIRMKSGFAATTYEQLHGSGYDGLTLLSYGILTTENQDIGRDSFVIGAKNVNRHDASDVELVGQTEQFSYCLSGIKSGQYHTRMAFRSYAVLSRNETEYVIYGPIMTRSAYQMAGMTLAKGQYAKDSEEYQLLTQVFH